MSIRRMRKIGMSVCFLLTLVLLAAGTSCPGGGFGTGGVGGLSPTPPVGNRPPRILIVSISTTSVVQGEPVVISISGADAEDEAVARVFASLVTNPTTSQELLIQGGIPIGPGAGSAVVPWETTSVPIGAYFIFAEIDDRTFDPVANTGNPAVRALAAEVISVTPQGSAPLNTPPQLVFLDPTPNLGLSSQDEVTVRYIYADTDSTVTVTLLLDKDLDPTNDNIDSPGDPSDPATNIIILPSAARLQSDPTFPIPADTAEIRTNPRSLLATPPGLLPFPGAPIAGQAKEYRFVVDFAQIPVRSQPYFVRATVRDELHTIHAYAIGSMTVSALASGTVDVTELGFRLAGARVQGFSPGDNLGSSYVGATDIDGDGVEEFMIAARFGTRFSLPTNPPPEPGMAYLIFGRRKSPFPPDTNGNGLPDVPAPGGGVQDFPVPPVFFPNPYDSRNVGRFGGVISINSVSTFFRGVTYAMPTSHILGAQPPPNLVDLDHPNLNNAGLTSIARVDMNDDDVADLVFGLPFCSALEYQDDDPSDAGPPGAYTDGWPNEDNCTNQPTNDDIGTVTQGIVIAVDGTSDLRNIFTRALKTEITGQFDPRGPVDDEGAIHSLAQTPQGVRFRGGWLRGAGLEGSPVDTNNAFGETVAAMADLDGDNAEELLISAPNSGAFYTFNPTDPPACIYNIDMSGPPPFDKCTYDSAGRVDVWLSNDYFTGDFYADDNVQSLPAYDQCPGGLGCVRCFHSPISPNFFTIYGSQPDDHFGGAVNAGQFNQDGVNDIMCGAPDADRQKVVNGVPTGAILSDNGVFYIIFTPAAQPGISRVESMNRLYIPGTHAGDRFGEIQSPVQDMNGDGISDVAFASENFDADITGATPGEEQNVGYVGVIFGNRPLTGEAGFSPDDVGTAVLPGVKFFGVAAGVRAGHRIASAGDFNSDGYGDLLISSPSETRILNGQTRRGVVYLIFGGQHLTNKSFNLAQVGSVQLPGIVFIGRSFVEDLILDNAPLETVGGIGDIDGDGFDDILIGAPDLDFVDPNSPINRRVDSGEVYLIYGSNFGTNRLPGS